MRVGDPARPTSGKGKQRVCEARGVPCLLQPLQTSVRVPGAHPALLPAAGTPARWGDAEPSWDRRQQCNGAGISSSQPCFPLRSPIQTPAPKLTDPTQPLCADRCCEGNQRALSSRWRQRAERGRTVLGGGGRPGAGADWWPKGTGIALISSYLWFQPTA